MGAITAVGSGFPRADHREGVAVTFFDLAPDVEEQRGIGQVLESGRPGRVFWSEKGQSALADGGEFPLQVNVVLPVTDGRGDFRANALNGVYLAFPGLEDALCGLETIEKTTYADWSQPGKEVEGEEAFLIGHGHYKRGGGKRVVAAVGSMVITARGERGLSI